LKPKDSSPGEPGLHVPRGHQVWFLAASSSCSGPPADERVVRRPEESAMQIATVDTRRVAGRRLVSLQTIDDLVVEVDLLTAATAAGPGRAPARQFPAPLVRPR